MRVNHNPGSGVWAPFAIIISFETEEETVRFYEHLQKENQPSQVQALGSYIEGCSEEQVQQHEESI
jgi:rubrerythrin